MTTPLESELYFLVAKFLEGGPCKNAAKVLIQELNDKSIIPKGVNWSGESFSQDFKAFSSKFSHIGPDHLPKLLECLLNKINANESVSIVGTKSLLSSKTSALLRSNSASLQNTESTFGASHRLLARRNGYSLPPNSENPPPRNFVSAILGRELCGSGFGSDLIKPDFYSSRINLSCRTLSHLSAVYCVLFDVTGKFIFTGADDKLVKVWSATNGRLLATLRGSHLESAEITDLAVNYENTLLAASSCDKLIRIWCLRTGAPITVLSGHGGTVTAIFFCPVPSSLNAVRYLGSTSTDGSCAFWAYTEEPGRRAIFQAKPTLYQERMRPGAAQMICASFSPGGVFMAAGSADYNVRVYYMLGSEGPERILEVQNHSDRVDSISWSHRGVRFISGSKDGTALVWRFENQQWRYIRLLCAKPTLGDPPLPVDTKQKPRVTMVGWNADDSLVLTAISNNLVKVWDPLNGNLVRVLRDHRDEVYVIESHPTNPRVVCTAAHDGNIFIWDIGTKFDTDLESGEKLFEHHNSLPDGQGYGAIFDVKWSPDALCLAATDSHGNLMIFNCGDNSQFVGLPTELFFHTDYRPLVMDAITHEVLDEQTQVAPHLMPPPFLVDVDGNPYPPSLQRLVPGRENCQEDQLIPNVAMAPTGYQEVIEGLQVFNPGENPRSNIDQMIEQLAAAQGVPGENDNGSGRRSGNRRSGEVEGVRQSRGNWQTTANHRYFKRNVVPPLSPSMLTASEEIRHAFATEEDQWYQDHKNRKGPSSGGGLFLPDSPMGTNNRDIKSRRLRRLAAQAAERRRQEELNQMDEREGIARPNPPQQEISLPQERTMTPRRPPRARPTNPGTTRRPRRARYTLPRADAPNRESENGHSSGESDSEFSSSDVAGSSSDSDSSESDWGVTPSGSPRKGSGAAQGAGSSRRRGVRNQSDSPPQHPKEEEESDEDYAEPKPGPSSQMTKVVKTEAEATTNRPRRAKKRAVVEVGGLEEIEEKFRPSEWLSEVLPKRTPYYPQIGDDVVYFRQGHEMYTKEVQVQGLYPMSKKDLKSLPWRINPELPAEVPARIVGLKFDIKPPRLVCLKLAIVDWEDGELTGVNINNVVYHDVSDVVDFLVLRQLYNKSMRHKWNVNDRFRCLIDNQWWLGTILSRDALSPQFPESQFMCYKAQWDNQDEERMSPWDIEIITDDFEIPKSHKGEAIPASEADLRSGMYEANARDWPPRGHQDAECIRMKTILENVMELAIAEPFLTPVDLNSYPTYAYEVEYFIDLSTIKSRLENHFYRRLDAVKFDIKHLAFNTEKFNQPRSDIVKQARIIRDICLHVMGLPEITEIRTVYHTMSNNFKWSDSDEENLEKINRRRARTSRLTNIEHYKTEPIQGPSTSSLNARSSSRLRHKETTRKGRRRGLRGDSDDSDKNKPWQTRCMELLNTICNSRDSVPFREPVDPVEYPDYYQQIDTPMDLQSVREDLLGNNYASPQAFAKDMQLIFFNSKIYNTDKHSQINIMTIRLQALFECQMKYLLDDIKIRRPRGSQAAGSSRNAYRNSSRNRNQESSPLKGSANVAGPSRGLRNSTMNGHQAHNTRSGSAISSPRKNPRRSAAAKNPYVQNEDSNNSDDDSSSEPVADGEAYRDSRPRRKRRRSEPNSSTSPSTAKKRRVSNGHETSSNLGSSPVRQVKKLRLGSPDITEERGPSTSPTRQTSSQINTRNNRSQRTGESRATTKPVRVKKELESEESEFDVEAQMPNLKKEKDESDQSNEDDYEDHQPQRFSQRSMSLRNRSKIKKRYSGTDDEDSDGRRKLRNRGRATKNYDETLGSDESESAPTLADRIKKSRRGSSTIKNGYTDHGDSEEDGAVSNEDQPGPSSRLRHENNLSSRRRTSRRIKSESDEDDEVNEEDDESKRPRRLRTSPKGKSNRKLPSEEEDEESLGEEEEEDDEEPRANEGRKTRAHPKRIITSPKQLKSKKLSSDEEELDEEESDNEDEEDNYSPNQAGRRKSGRKRKLRKVKSGSEDEENHNPSTSRRRRGSVQKFETGTTRSTRRGLQKPHYNEETDDEDVPVSFSSRGRIRKPRSWGD